MPLPPTAQLSETWEMEQRHKQDRHQLLKWQVREAFHMQRCTSGTRSVHIHRRWVEPVSLSNTGSGWSQFVCQPQTVGGFSQSIKHRQGAEAVDNIFTCTYMYMYWENIDNSLHHYTYVHVHVVGGDGLNFG